MVDPEQEVQLLQSNQNLQNDVLAAMPGWYRTLASGICGAVPSKQLRKWLMPLPGHQGIFKLPLKVMNSLKQGQPLSGTVEPGDGDILLLPDAYWAHEEIWPAVRQAKQRGAFIASIAYDLIPLTHSQFVAEGAADSFKKYLHQLAVYSDLIVAISDTVREEVANALPELWPNEEICRDIRSFELGAQFKQKDGFVRDEIKKAFDSKRPPYLMVGTIDPRKNHGYVLDAFDRIWEQDPEARLCIVGSISSQANEIIQRIWAHPKYGEQLVALHNVSDAELNYAYGRASAVCFASIVEGFGLPIVEALWYGRDVFASDTKIHREVGQDRCHYCRLDDPSDLANQILAWESNGRPNRVQEGMVKPKTWQQSTLQLFTHCLESYEQWTVAKQQAEQTPAELVAA